jgi:UDP:flavonoid glycosyltransferase YjiC (YdhE family)
VSEYLFVPFPAHGHVNPVLPVIAELVRRGEDVRVFVTRDFAGVVRKAGATAAVLPVEFEVHVPDRAFGVDGPRWVRARLRRWSARTDAVAALREELGSRLPDLVVVWRRLAIFAASSRYVIGTWLVVLLRRFSTRSLTSSLGFTTTTGVPLV